MSMEIRDRDTLNRRRRDELVTVARRIVELDDQLTQELLNFEGLLKDSGSTFDRIALAVESGRRAREARWFAGPKIGTPPASGSIGAKVLAVFNTATTPTVKTSHIIAQLPEVKSKDVRSAMNYLKNKHLIDMVERGVWKLTSGSQLGLSMK
jgi:hypothetical protein